jgi:hypothetical protein
LRTPLTSHLSRPRIPSYSLLSDKKNNVILSHSSVSESGEGPQVLLGREVASDNLSVLCDLHHRVKFFGIHQITDPVWGTQNILRDDFIALVRTEIAERQTKNRPRPTAKKARG